jgi:hypothetical protein
MQHSSGLATKKEAFEHQRHVPYSNTRVHIIAPTGCGRTAQPVQYQQLRQIDSAYDY